MKVRSRYAVALLSGITLYFASGHLNGNAPADGPAGRPHVHALGGTPGVAQTVRGGRATPLTLPLAVDGSKEPERIPDRLALFHLIMALSERDAPNELAAARRDALLETIALSPADRGAMVAALRGVRQGLDQVAAARRNLTAEALVEVSALVTADELKKTEDSLLEGAYSRLTATLSAEGFARLESYVRDRVKRRIVVYGAPPRQ